MSLDHRVTSLISIGVSVGVNCQPCLKHHVAHAKELGITEQEIQDAINVGKTVKRGAANSMDRYIEEIGAEKPTASAGAEKSCGCGCG